MLLELLWFLLRHIITTTMMIDMVMNTITKTGAAAAKMMVFSSCANVVVEGLVAVEATGVATTDRMLLVARGRVFSKLI